MTGTHTGITTITSLQAIDDPAVVQMIKDRMASQGIASSGDAVITRLPDIDGRPDILVTPRNKTSDYLYDHELEDTPFGQVVRDGDRTMLVDRRTGRAVADRKNQVNLWPAVDVLHPDWVDGPPQHLTAWFIRHPVTCWRVSANHPLVSYDYCESVLPWYTIMAQFGMVSAAGLVGLASTAAGFVAFAVMEVVAMLWTLVNAVRTTHEHWGPDTGRITACMGQTTTITGRTVDPVIAQLGTLMFGAGTDPATVHETMRADNEMLNLGRKRLSAPDTTDEQRQHAQEALDLVASHVRQAREARTQLETARRLAIGPDPVARSKALDEQSRLEALVEQARPELQI